VLHSFLQFTDALEAVAIDSDLPCSYKTAATTPGEKLSLSRGGVRVVATAAAPRRCKDVRQTGH
jgi:hypothetical protein